jgi:hypothetical protein
MELSNEDRVALNEATLLVFEVDLPRAAATFARAGAQPRIGRCRFTIDCRP